jgi:lipoic acid synthetase
MSFFYPLITMERRLPIIDSEVESSVGCGSSSTISPLEKRKNMRKRLPSWFKTSLPTGQSQSRYNGTKGNVMAHGLNTVCEEARCPNVHDCWGRGTATFMVAGEVCTRGCRFCAIGTVKTPPELNAEEPKELADAVFKMGLSYAVITVVNRDDLQDGGAMHYRDCIVEVSNKNPDVGLELLCSDLDGNLDALEKMLDGLPLRVFAHNVECVPRLDKIVRDQRASFGQSLEILRKAKEIRPELLTKTSLMVGLGETDEEIEGAMGMIREAGVDMITLGQYLQPSFRHLPVDRFPEPDSFADWDGLARDLGFSAVASGPLVRSSYRAGLLWEEAMGGEPVVTRDSTGSAVSHVLSQKRLVVAEVDNS